MLKIRLFSLIAIWLLSAITLANPVDHSAWDELLKENVKSGNGGQSTTVDYQGMQNEQKKLDAYLASLAAITPKTFDGMKQSDQLALLINAYNAWTVKLILTEWPDLDSIKDLGSLFSSPWKKEFVKLLGKTRSLDDIEHKLIRGSDRYNDPRIHFAVNCASIGCPALRAEAYVGARLDQQLNKQTRLFLLDHSRNRVSGDELELSSIFKWYGEDFEKGWKGYHRLEDFLLAYGTELGLSDSLIKELKNGDAEINYLDYDWHLNKQ